MSISLGTQVIAANTATTFQAPSDGCKAILIGNESGLTVTITMESGGVQKTLYPSTIDWFDVRRGFTGVIKITPTVLLNNVASFPASSLIFDAIGLNDPEDASQYPVTLNRSMTIGGNVNTVGGTSSAIVNDNNAASTSIMEATVTADGSSAVSLTNDAVFKLGDVAHPGSLTMAGNLSVTGTSGLTGVVTAAAANTLGTAGNLQHILGKLTVDQLATFSDALSVAGKHPTQLTGSVSGTLDLYQLFVGTVKLVYVNVLNFQDAANRDITLPTAFTGTAAGVNINSGNFDLVLSGVAQNVDVMTLFNAANTAGSFTTINTVNSHKLWLIQGGFDTIHFYSHAATTGGVFIIGV